MGSSAVRPAAALVPAAIDTVARLSRLVTRVLADLDEPLTIRQLRILTRLERGDAAIGLLATRSGVRAPSMSGTVDGMVDRGWVRRAEDPTDRRRRTIHLTSAGRRTLEQAQEGLSANLSGLLAGLSEREVAALVEGLAATARELDRRWEQLIERTDG